MKFESFTNSDNYKSDNFEGFLESNNRENDPNIPFLKVMTRREILSRAKKLLFSDAFAVGLGIGYLDKKRLEAEENTTPKLSGDIISSEKTETPSEIISESDKTEQVVEDEITEVEDVDALETRQEIDFAEYKKIKPELSYQEKHPPIKIENFNVPGGYSKWGASTVEGKIACTLVYKDITDAVEDRYNLPPGILSAMIMEESTGIDLLPNGRGDGGFGLCHMQGSTAAEFGLKTFCGCNSLVCNSHRGCKKDGEYQNHAKQLAELMKEKSDDREALVEADERLHIILNLDAAGRMLASYMSGPKLKGNLSDLGPFRTAIARYAGSVNYKNYWEDIVKNMGILSNSNHVLDAVSFFDQENPDLKVNGERAGYSGYVQAMKVEFENYGLSEYKQLPKYKPKNSDGVLLTYQEFIK